MQHLSDDHLDDYILGKFPEGIELIILEDHLFRCQECFARFQLTQRYFRVMDVNLDRERRRPLWQVLTNGARRSLKNLGIVHRVRAS